MVKCVVSGCPNREESGDLGLFNRPPRRFFSFPKDPGRVKVWLAALRETDGQRQDSTDRRLICEDHFLPEDISSAGVDPDAIPIMPPCLDGDLGTISPWGAESSEEEDQWAAGGDDVPAAVEPPGPKPPAVNPPQQDPGVKKTSEAKSTSLILNQTKEMIRTKKAVRQDMSLGCLTQRFLEMLLTAPDGSLDLRQAMAKLQTRRQRVSDITNILHGISFIEKLSANRVKWIGKSPISWFLCTNREKLQRELENLKLVEDTLDSIIRTCRQQLFNTTNDTENSAMAYVTHEDISRVRAFQDQTLFVVKAPEETKLEVSAPGKMQDRIQVRLRSRSGPIMVQTCDIRTGDGVTRETSGCFVTLAKSRIKMAMQHTAGIRRPVTQEDRDWALQSLSQLGRFTGMGWILSPEAPQTLPVRTFDVSHPI
ncbi:transcription factor E2F1 isoform X2 [Lates calcarifer]|uniref:Transcription factor E2F1 isoform X2 n=1 Tax=Lates calcarifer TaxID=8187 RepID=A0AAJ8B9B8_LATCA|nr:transcription factor E2F1 isoform X2 [Lates calcarifer]